MAADRFVLLSALLLGATGIIFLKQPYWTLFPDSPRETSTATLIAAAWTAVVLIAYAIIVRLTSHTQVEPEIVGDNCYYLGFLFTLVSLAVTLFELGFAVTDEDLLKSIISGFGIALSSTIIGIALRVWFFQQRTDLVARDRENRHEIQKVVREFRAAMAESSAQLKNYSTESVQLTAERDKKIREATDKIIKMQLSASNRLIAEVDKIVDQQRRTLEDSAEQFIRVVERSMNQGFSRIENDIRSALVGPAAAAFADLERATRLLAQKMDQLRERDLHAASELGDETLRTWRQLNTITTELIRTASETAQTLHAAIENDIRSALVGPAAAAFADLERATRLLAQKMDQLRERDLHAASELGDETLRTWRQLNTITTELIRTASETAQTLHAATEKSVKARTRTSGSIKYELHEISRKLDNFIELLTKLANEKESILEPTPPTIRSNGKPAQDGGLSEKFSVGRWIVRHFL